MVNLEMTAQRPAAPRERADDAELVVRGGRRLRGTTAVSGFKHCLVTLVAAAAAGTGTVRIAGCPDIVETRVLTELLRGFGARAERDGDVLTIDAGGLACSSIATLDAGRIHGSVYLAPALLAKTGRAVIPAGGGCRIGDGPAQHRPVAQYVSVLERFGADARALPGGDLEVAAGTLRGTEIDLLDYAADRAAMTGPLYSGAAKMALLAAAVAEGVSVLRHPYPKPDFTDLADMLRDFGADVERSRGGSVIVRGRGSAALDRDTTQTLIPDLIEVVTWLCAGALYGDGPLTATGAGMHRAVRALAPELDVLTTMGLHIDTTDRSVTVHPADHLEPVDCVIASHGVYSDSQPFIALLAAHAQGQSRITETVWGQRFGYAGGLAELGMTAQVSGNTLTVHGVRPPYRVGRSLVAGDLRAAAVLLLAALGVPGTTSLRGTGHLARGYADLPGALRRLGADLTVRPV
ncbi:hypothetical protein [Actinocrinis sp.]|uniref:hypothetical protein n=1 Tax=Actinocrinis sp. TaxID=1920516 RepID=UPI002CB90EFD|nr:hypothetical protein [Actinocrinis sp.]HXR72532.1 hypothetical protein [Actinocrinis sp.]